jgi:hypothetical protein
MGIGVLVVLDALCPYTELSKTPVAPMLLRRTRLDNYPPGTHGFIYANRLEYLDGTRSAAYSQHSLGTRPGLTTSSRSPQDKALVVYAHHPNDDTRSTPSARLCDSGHTRVLSKVRGHYPVPSRLGVRHTEYVSDLPGESDSDSPKNKQDRDAERGSSRKKKPVAPSSQSSVSRGRSRHRKGLRVLRASGTSSNDTIRDAITRGWAKSVSPPTNSPPPSRNKSVHSDRRSLSSERATRIVGGGGGFYRRIWFGDEVWCATTW